MPIQNTDNHNYLNPSRFVFIIDQPGLEHVEFSCQLVSIPGISVDSIPTQFRGMRANMTGSSIVFEPFTARFIIDETLENYSTIFNWLYKEMGSDQPEQTLHKDLILLIYTNNNNVKTKIHMISTIPTSLSPVEFETTKTDTQYLYADVSFNLDYYQIRQA